MIDPVQLARAKIGMALAKQAGMQKESMSIGLRARAALERAKRWATGREFVDLSKKPRPTFPAVNGETAVAQEAEALAGLGKRTGLLRDLHDTPYFHLKDRIAGGMVGAPLGLAADNMIGYDDDANGVSTAARKLLALTGGAYLGGRGANAMMNVGRQYLANTTHLYGYGAANVKRPTLKGLWEHGVMDKPSESALLANGPAQGKTDPRYELFRRYLGIHADAPTKDLFLRQADGTLRFNPATFNKDSPYWKQYMEPLMSDERLATRFHWKAQEPMKLTDLKPNQRARVEQRLETIRAAKQKADEARLAAEEAAKQEAARPKLILPGQQPQGPRGKLIIPGMEQAEAQAAPVSRLAVPGEPPPQAAKKLSVPGQAEALPPDADQALFGGKTPWWRKPGQFVHDQHSQPSAPRYESDATKNPMNTIFGSHDTRDLPHLTRQTMGGNYQKGIEIGDLWDLHPASWERNEFSHYLGGLGRTSPQNWRRYLSQEATHAHPDSVVGKTPLVGPRMASFGMRTMAENMFGKEAPVIRQQMLLDYRAPKLNQMQTPTDRLYQGPTTAHLVNDMPIAPRSAAPESVRRLQHGAAGVAGALGLASLPTLMPSRPGETQTAEAPPPAPPQQSPQQLVEQHAKPLDARSEMRQGIFRTVKSTLGNLWNRITARHDGGPA